MKAQSRTKKKGENNISSSKRREKKTLTEKKNIGILARLIRGEDVILGRGQKDVHSCNIQKEDSLRCLEVWRDMRHLNAPNYQI